MGFDDTALGETSKTCTISTKLQDESYAFCLSRRFRLHNHKDMCVDYYVRLSISRNP